MGTEAPRALGQIEGPGLPCPVLSAAPSRPWGSSVLAGTQHALLAKAQVPVLPRPTWGVGEFPRDHHHALRLQVLMVLTRCWSCSGKRQHEREDTVNRDTQTDPTGVSFLLVTDSKGPSQAPQGASYATGQSLKGQQMPRSQ